MRIGVTLALFIAMTSAAFAGGGFDIVIPGRPGVPIIISGVDASYAVVEGDWGLGKGTQVQPTVYGGRYDDPVPNVGHYYPSAGRMPGYGRLEIEPPANRRLPQPAESYHQSWSAQSAPLPAQSNVPVNPPEIIYAPQDYRRRPQPISTLRKSSQRKHRQESVMRHLIKGLIAAVAVMAAAPAMACGYNGCWQPPVYVAPVAAYGYRVAIPAAAGSANVCPIRSSSIITSTRVRPIPVPVTLRRTGSIAKARSPATAMATTVRTTVIAHTATATPGVITASACCAATTDPVAIRKLQRPLASRERAFSHLQQFIGDRSGVFLHGSALSRWFSRRVYSSVTTVGLLLAHAVILGQMFHLHGGSLPAAGISAHGDDFDDPRGAILVGDHAQSRLHLHDLGWAYGHSAAVGARLSRDLVWRLRRCSRRKSV